MRDINYILPRRIFGYETKPEGISLCMCDRRFKGMLSALTSDQKITEVMSFTYDYFKNYANDSLSLFKWVQENILKSLDIVFVAYSTKEKEPVGIFIENKFGYYVYYEYIDTYPEFVRGRFLK